MHTDEEVYKLVHRSEGVTRRGIKRNVVAPFRYRVWLGRGLEPVCLVTMNNAKDVGPDTRYAIRRAILDSVVGFNRIRYFECVITSQRLITEVYFPGDRSVVGSPCGEMRDLAYLERVLGLQVSVV